jgi:hypothetical protein
MDAVYKRRAFNEGRYNDRKKFLEVVLAAAREGLIVPADAKELVDAFLHGQSGHVPRFHFGLSTRKYRGMIHSLEDQIATVTREKRNAITSASRRSNNVTTKGETK